MNTHPEAQIFLADQRGCSETARFRSHHTFNFGAYRHEGREPFGALYLLNDDTLRAGASLSLHLETPSDVLLLPVTGGMEYRGEGANGFLEPGQAGLFSLPKGTSYTVSNPYEKESIQFLQIGLSWPGADAGFRAFEFDFGTKNTLLPLLDAPEAAFIGRYDGREEGVFPVKPDGQPRRIFVFVLNGVFEVANRLLHARDGLALTYREDGEVDFEALSNDAVLVLLSC